MAQPSPANREGDWSCDGCQNRNYAFRSFCNRCKQPRLLVDSKTPSDSKWLPRIGDWICAGCSNNNYASREKCNKCGTPKEVAALPAMALPGAAVAAPTFAHNHLMPAGGFGLGVNNASSISYHTQSNWSFGGTALGSTTGNNNAWRPGDWLCMCGFHNYSSRSMCKQCQQPMQPASLTSVLQPILSGMSLSTNCLSLLQAASELSGVGMKRPASDEIGNDLKRLHAAESTAFQNQRSTVSEPANVGSPSWLLQPSTQAATLTLVPAIVGKGAKQWRSGDWMCAGCNNHNFASRTTCNRCGGKKETMSQVLSVA